MKKLRPKSCVTVPKGKKLAIDIIRISWQANLRARHRGSEVCYSEIHREDLGSRLMKNMYLLESMLCMYVNTVVRCQISLQYCRSKHKCTF
jgi:hypothetical protein